MDKILIRSIMFLLALLLMLSGAFGYFYYFEKEFPVEVVEVGYGAVDEVVKMSGNLDAEKTETVLANTEGIIANLSLKEGNRVRAGQKLCLIRSPALRGQLLEMQAEVVTAQENLKRSVTEEEKKMANARVLYIQANIADLEETMQPRAHINGEIIKISVQNGSEVIAGRPLFFIAEMEKPVVKARMEEIDLQKIKDGQPLWIEGDFLSKQRLPGKVYQIGKSVNRDNGTYIEISGKIFNPQKLPLKYGAFAEVGVITDRKPNVLCMPVDALIVDGREYVFLVEDGRARKVQVTLGTMGEKCVEIRTGLKAKDRVVTFGNLELKDGARIKINLPQKP